MLQYNKYMLREIIEKYGKEKVNTLTKYPSILTLHKFGERGRFTNGITTNIEGETMYASEKIDGTNVRIICYGEEFLVGSRNNILHYSKDFYWDESMGIVNQFYKMNLPVVQPDKLTIIFGELFGGKITANSKDYGKEDHGYRVFDIAIIDDLDILEESITAISNWRESSLDSSIDDTLAYGQRFLNLDELKSYNFDLVPQIKFELENFEHLTVLNALEKYISQTNVALTETARGGTEGVVLRNHDRTKIVKLRFEDYRRTLKSKK
ncbi:MAG: RNA ligase family protein [Bacteroidota bacterium]